VATKFTLGKHERLKSRKRIEQLFKSGKGFTSGPFRVYYAMESSQSPMLQFGVGVSSKNFKKSVDRNRIKRLTREAYRLQKNVLQEKVVEKNISLDLFFIFTGRELPVYSTIQEKTAIILNKLIENISSNT
jgi:ribonuclease P protein component